VTPSKQDEQRREQAVAVFLSSKCASVKCPLCGKSVWKSLDLSALVTVEVGYLTGDIGEPHLNLYPSVPAKALVIPIRCACGFLMLFSAEAIGAEPRAC
jgi:hypothetical protein